MESQERTAVSREPLTGIWRAGTPARRAASRSEGESPNRTTARDESGEIAEGLQQEAGGGLAAIALAAAVGAEVDGGEEQSGGGEKALHFRVDQRELLQAQLIQGDGALIGDHDQAEAVGGQEREAGEGAGKELEFSRRGDVLAFRLLAVEDAVAV